MTGETRLDKLVADQGYVSRKDAKSIIRRGRVFVNGAVATQPDLKIASNDRVELDGKSLNSTGHSYLMLNKPAGVVCATKDPKSTTVLDILPGELLRKGLFPAGRLDKDTEGFVLITDDGALAHKILSPKNHVPKTYRAEVAGAADWDNLIAAFAKGILLDGGETALPAELTVLETGLSSLVELVIYEGKYHQVKRMFGAFSLSVTWLCRTAIGALPLDSGLALGEARPVTADELLQLQMPAGNWMEV